jgi:hypothetical protein
VEALGWVFAPPTSTHGGSCMLPRR